MQAASYTNSQPFTKGSTTKEKRSYTLPIHHDSLVVYYRKKERSDILCPSLLSWSLCSSLLFASLVYFSSSLAFSVSLFFSQLLISYCKTLRFCILYHTLLRRIYTFSLSTSMQRSHHFSLLPSLALFLSHFYSLFFLFPFLPTL